MVFRVVNSHSSPSEGNEILLVVSDWNDWFLWHTQFHVILAMANQPRVSLGSVKIAQRGMTSANPRTVLLERFPSLDESYYSIGQSENCY